MPVGFGISRENNRSYHTAGWLILVFRNTKLFESSSALPPITQVSSRRSSNHAGPVFVDAVREVGFGLLLAGVFVTLVPQFIGLLIGRYVLRMNPLLLLGALSGAQTMTAALAALQEKSGSPVAVLGYTAAVPLGHILLTSGGTVFVWLMS
jgi:hypothetical protein